jgi:hypothetical protein
VISVTSQTLDHVHFSGLPTTLSVGVPVTFQVTALDAGGQTIQGFTGPLTFSDVTGTLNVSSVSWSNGVATVTATVGAAIVRDRVTVSSGSYSAPSDVFNVLGPIAAFRVSVTPAASIVKGTPATVTITAVDAAGQVVVGFAGAVTLTDASGAMTVLAPTSWLAGIGTTSVSFPTPIARDRVTVVDAGGDSGQSTVFAVVAASPPV